MTEYYSANNKDGQEVLVVIQPDEDPVNPLEYRGDDDAILMMAHRRYRLGHDGAEDLVRDYFRSHPKFETLAEEDQDMLDHNISRFIGLFHHQLDAFAMPIYMYEHSGIALSTSNDGYPFNCRFASGLAGWAVWPCEWANRVFGGDDKMEPVNLSELVCEDITIQVEHYSQYLDGDVRELCVYDVAPVIEFLKEEHSESYDSLRNLPKSLLPHVVAFGDMIDSSGGYYDYDIVDVLTNSFGLTEVEEL